MDDKQIEKVFGYLIVAVVGYFIVREFFPFLIMGIVGLFMLRFLNHRK